MSELRNEPSPKIEHGFTDAKLEEALQNPQLIAEIQAAQTQQQEYLSAAQEKGSESHVRDARLKVVMAEVAMQTGMNEEVPESSARAQWEQIAQERLAA